MKTIVFPKDGKMTASLLARQYEKAYHESIEKAANAVLEKEAGFIFLAGPSCSGKTTTALELIAALEKRGKRVMTFSTDDFFFDGKYAPKNEDGTPDYDAFDHTDSDFIVTVLKNLSRGKNASLPVFDFKTGNRLAETRRIFPEDYDIFILEGIHALNDVILAGMPTDEKYVCFYLDVTASVQAQGETEVLSPTQIRFCRRIIRDFKHRFAGAERSYSLWKNVLEKEKEILHPFRKNALFTISTDFCYEVAVEKDEVIALLDDVDKDGPFYEKAMDLKRKLEPFPSLSSELVPKNSVLREFID